MDLGAKLGVMVFTSALRLIVPSYATSPTLSLSRLLLSYFTNRRRYASCCRPSSSSVMPPPPATSPARAPPQALSCALPLRHLLCPPPSSSCAHLGSAGRRVPPASAISPPRLVAAGPHPPCRRRGYPGASPCTRSAHYEGFFSFLFNIVKYSSFN